MQKKKRKTLARILVVAPLLLVTYILQSMVFTHLPIFGAKPLLLPVAVCGVALFDGAAAGGIFGILAGILCDMSFNEPAITFTLLLTAVGVGVGLLSETILVRGFPSFLLVTLGALLVCAFVQMFPLLFFRGVPFSPLLDTGVRQTLSSLVFTIPMYYLSRFVSRALS